MVIYKADKKRRKKEKEKKYVYFIFLVSVVNKSQYCDTHSEDTIGNVQDTDYLSFVWSY